MHTETIYHNDGTYESGYECGWMNINYVDENGKRIKRIPEEYPYSYDGYILYRCHPNEHRDSTVYSDRIWQWDRYRAEELWQKHNPKKRWDTASLSGIQEFLREFNGDPQLEITFIMQYCNVSNGFPLWRVDYKSGKK